MSFDIDIRPRRTPAKSTQTIYYESLVYIFVADSMGLSSFKFVCIALQKTHLFCNRVRFGRSVSSKVNDLGANRKRVCDFVLVRHCDYGPILHRL